jgi:hypothetical protein
MADRPAAGYSGRRRQIVLPVTLLPAVTPYLDTSYSEQLAAADTRVTRRGGIAPEVSMTSRSNQRVFQAAGNCRAAASKETHV